MFFSYVPKQKHLLCLSVSAAMPHKTSQNLQFQCGGNLTELKKPESALFQISLNI